MAVRLALGETHLINETKKVLEKVFLRLLLIRNRKE